MLAKLDEVIDPEQLERIRKRVRSRGPHVVARVEQLMMLAAIAAQGPDPEAALVQLQAAYRTLRAFLRVTGHI